MSGNDDSDEQHANRFVKSIALIIFHFEISGIVLNNVQYKNKAFISVTLFIFQFEISGNDVNDEH